MILNLAWALCSLTLAWLWIRSAKSNPMPRQAQILALAMVVLVLLPAISLSDDRMAMQGPAESDTSVRRALHLGEGHPSVVPVSFAQPEQIFPSLPWNSYALMAIQTMRLAPTRPLLDRSLDRRPPPQA